MKKTLILTACLLAAAWSPSTAQVPDERGTANAPCYRSRPTPDCRVFFITNAGVHFRPTTTPDYSRFNPILDWGIMVNTGRRDAIGGDWFVLLEDADFATGPRLRYRRWLDGDRSLDVALGATVAGGPAVRPGTVVGLIQYNPVHWIGFGVRPEYVRRSDYTCGPSTCAPITRGSMRIAGGVEIGWVPGLILSLSSGAVLGFLVLAFAGVD